MLITHCSFTSDPPQKCKPALQARGLAGVGTRLAARHGWNAGRPLTGCGC